MLNTLNLIKSDLHRYTGKNTLKNFIKNFLFNRGFNFSFWLRLAAAGGLISFIAKPIHFYKRRKYGIDISYKTKIGFGLYIGHGGPLVVSPTATIGDNCNLSQYTTIGSNIGNAASIGNNVYIGPNVCIVESVKIGNCVTIGAGSVVTKDIPDNSTAVGNSAKVIHSNNPGQFVARRWIKENSQQ